MTENDEFNVEEYLKEYIRVHLDYGYTSSSISNVLINFGYPEEMIENIFLHVKMSPSSKKTMVKKIKPSKLTKDLFVYIINLLVDYIQKQSEQGYDKKEIIRVLETNGFEKFVIEEAYLIVENKKSIEEVVEYLKKKKKILYAKNEDTMNSRNHAKHEKKSPSGLHKDNRDEGERVHHPFLHRMKLPATAVYGISLGIFVFVILFMSMLTGTSINKVFIGFFATFMSITVTYAYVLFLPKTEVRKFVPLFAIVLTLIVFFVIIFFGKEYVTISQYDVVLILNVILVFILSSFITNFSTETEGGSRWHPKHEKGKEQLDAVDDKLVKETDKENKTIYDYIEEKEEQEVKEVKQSH